MKRFSYVVLFFMSLSVFVLAMALSPSASASVQHRIGGGSVRSEVAPIARAPIGGGGGGVCNVAIKNPSVNLRPETVSGSATIIGCVGAAACSEFAQLQEESPTNPGNWFVVASGNRASGCSPGNGSIVVKRCTSTAHVFHTYRTQGIFSVVWDDGQVTGGVVFYSNNSVLQWAC